MTRPLRWTRAAAGALGAVAAFSAHAGDGIGASLFVADDSEGFSTRRVALGYLPVYAQRDAHSGFRIGSSHYAQDSWRRDTHQLTFVHRALDPATTDGVQIEAGLSRQNGHDLLTVDAGYRTSLAERRSIELFVNRDWVETRRALDEGTSFTFAGAALEQGLGERVTLVGVAGYQDFSDGNRRTHGRARLIVQPSLELGLTVQARYRTYRSDVGTVARSYFNPERYSEAMLALGWRKRVEGWNGSLTAGVGRQRVDDAPRSGTRLLEASLDSPLRANQSLRVRAGYNRSASFGGPNYSYRYAQAEWHMAF